MAETPALPPSLYADTAPPAPPTPPLQGDHSCAVAVVGAGYTGLSAALHLAEQGVDVTVLEAAEPGWGASGRNGGQINPGLKDDPDAVEARFGRALGGRMVAMGYAAPDLVFDLVARHGIACAAQRSGTIRAAYAARDVPAIRASFEQCARRDMPVELLEGDALRAATGSARYVCAMLDRRGGQLEPLAYARGLAAAALRAGARIHGGTRVTRLVRDSDAWRLDTPRGAVRARQVILATNGYTDDLWPGLRQSIVPVFSAITASEPMPETLARAVLPMRSSLYEVGRITVYVRVDGANRLLIGGRSVQREVARAEELRYLSDYAARLWPETAGLRWTHGWAGRIAITTDHYPHLHEPAPGLLAALGYNGRGVAMATMMGRQLARRVQGAAVAELDMPVTPIAPIPLHRFWRVGVEARIAWGRVQDRFGF
ncbi:NAD(P)/FAD-dependent oxidoreductase [Falsiroseomonas oryzae]|uniref:NAD(P)/FAD-dependent oxidoreductase n=1 Tax=Falsiroseomonas oryzae TaxID=2766473 RepID=UPI0022EA39EC|nr:FAD-binding oxidoreductase [Roseomonas sp. MO-31]